MRRAVLALLLAFPARALGEAGALAQDPILDALRAELTRSTSALRGAWREPLYYLAYQVHDNQSLELTAELGALRADVSKHARTLDVDARVGGPRFDNTHQFKGDAFESDDSRETPLPLDDDPAALRAALWLRTEAAYQEAVQRYAKVEANLAVTAEEEDRSGDFSLEEPPQQAYESAGPPALDVEAWRARVRRLSSAFKRHPFALDSQATLALRAENRYFADSRGSALRVGRRYIRLSYRVSGRSTDGMDLERFKSYDAERLEDLPSEEATLRDAEASAAELKALLDAPLAEPYTGPAIIKNRATGVYFHEILGHRLEGHRQKIEREGQTFTKMLGRPVVAPFLGVVDDPTLPAFRGQFLRGAYRFDDEGVPSRRTVLIENGILKGFLLSRAPIKGFPLSNGHGRRSSGFKPVARMGNLIVFSSKAVPYAQLRRLLLEQLRRQKKPYGLVFEDITGGFTTTSRRGPQSFKVLPLLVYRVYADGRPDEAVRGVDIVGTPLTAFGKIIAAADDDDVFNGTCGAESGWVPVSAVAPSVLISELEVEKKAKSSAKPPILPAPHHDRGAP